ncbi:acylphosphatase [Natronoglycomyces albus]|uniref:Acylphosphatase n=1 Tax=Natronoglycomyces albus TaxID=2811108 RepID=A0A895XTP9_9ACTN|nr:acylphosphatase [Natronoglycomyces albus]QSB05018.1 acylphosphatase [Natronoglycomyces albus]
MARKLDPKAHVVTIEKISLARKHAQPPAHNFDRPGQQILVGVHARDDSSEQVTHWGQVDIDALETDMVWEELTSLAKALPGTAINRTSWKVTSGVPAAAEAINGALASLVRSQDPPSLSSLRRLVHRPLKEVDEVELATSAQEYAVYPETRPDIGAAQNDYSHYLIPGAMEGPNGTSLREETALRMGLEVLRLSRNTVAVSVPGEDVTLLFEQGRAPLMSHGATSLVADKGITRKILKRHRIPVAPGFTTSQTRLSNFKDKVSKLGFPLVVKPARGSKGEGITTGIEQWDDLEKAVGAAHDSRFRGNKIVVERHMQGEDYRFLCTQNSALSITRRQRASVLGNGHNSVLELITLHNVGRRKVPSCRGTLIHPNEEVRSWITSQGHDLNSIPRSGERVFLAGVNNVSQGGVGVEVLDETHPTLTALAIKSLRATGLNFGGVDMIIPNHRLPADEQAIAVTEVNTSPSLTGHFFPNFGPGRDVFAEFLRQHLARHDIDVPPMQEKLCVQVSIRGHVAGVGYGSWMAAAATELDVDGSIRVDDLGHRAEAILYGEARAVSTIVRRSIEGPPEASPAEVFTRRFATVPERGFSVIGH